MTISVHINEYLPISENRLQRHEWRLLIRRAVIGLAMLLIVLLALPGLLRIGGMQVVTVRGHSMGQAVPDQSIVITRSVSGDSLRRGDVVVFVANWSDGVTTTTSVVHRLSLITPTRVVWSDIRPAMPI